MADCEVMSLPIVDYVSSRHAVNANEL